MERVIGAFLELVGLLTILVVTVRYVAGMTKRQTELSEIDERIKASLREELNGEKSRGASERDFATQRENVLSADYERASRALDDMSGDRDGAVTSSGAAVIAADMALGYASWQLRKLREEEQTFLASGLRPFTNLLAAAVTEIAGAASPAARFERALRAASDLAGEYGKVVASRVEMSRRAQAAARLAASWTPMAFEESKDMGPHDSGQAMLERIAAKYFRDEGPLSFDGTVRRRLLGGEYVDPSQ